MTIHKTLPDTILLLGTDASGKNHVSQRFASYFKKRGRAVVLVEGWLNAAPSVEDASKSKWSHLKEWFFLFLFPMLRFVLPALCAYLMRRDAKRYVEESEQTHLVVSHTALRILAFTLGSSPSWSENKSLSPSLKTAISGLRSSSKTVVIVLDVEDTVRQARIRQRVEAGSADPFDRYMARDSERSERIEACLVWLARTYLDAALIENNNLNDEGLFRELERVLTTH